MRWLPLILALPLVLAAGGCGDGSRQAAAQAAAVAMLRAAADGDGATACALLAPETAAAVAEEQESTCAEGLLKEDLPAPGAARDTEVYGQWAQVRFDGDTVFLAAFRGGWRVVAAACEPRGEDRPYDCAIQGG